MAFQGYTLNILSYSTISTHFRLSGPVLDRWAGPPKVPFFTISQQNLNDSTCIYTKISPVPFADLPQSSSAVKIDFLQLGPDFTQLGPLCRTSIFDFGQMYRYCSLNLPRSSYWSLNLLHTVGSNVDITLSRTSMDQNFEMNEIIYIIIRYTIFVFKTDQQLFSLFVYFNQIVHISKTTKVTTQVQDNFLFRLKISIK